jgi:2-polyprenyl-3-methyl-5-hydroxy-6-metoxy-1,4-benzoquinol methylase
MLGSVGCGSGKLAVFLSKLGAELTAIDIGFDLVYESRALSRANNISCNFQQANTKRIPFRSNTFDIVVGLAVLHHLSEYEVPEVIEDTRGVLKNDGVAVFYKTVENSKIFDYIQKIFPQEKRESVL